MAKDKDKGKEKEEEIKEQGDVLESSETLEVAETLEVPQLDEVPEVSAEVDEVKTEIEEEASEIKETQEIPKIEFPSQEIETDGTVTVQPVKFASFEELSQAQGELNKNLEILMDIKLQLTVELGRTELPIKKVLELTRGSIIELEKVAGEPVELYANGKLVAHGEVVVIEDNFGLRITSITEPEDRLKGIQ